jgi:uncharacterized protein with HEPN domain
MRREELYLRDIVEAANHIAGFIAGLDPPGFQESELVRSAVVQKLAVIGEAAARVSELGRDEGPLSRDPLAEDCGIPEHTGPGVFWDRLG